MENSSSVSKIGLVLADTLKSKNGPLYMGIATIGILVLGWKALDEKYQYQNGDICFKSDSTPVQMVVSAETNNVPADNQ